MKALKCIDVFNLAIADFHIKEHVDALTKNPYTESSIEHILYSKCWIDTVQWHLEDLIRIPELDPKNAFALKKRIDKSNQNRTDMVEKIDDYYLLQWEFANLTMILL